MITLSGVLIVKDEEDVLERAILSFLPILDELIIIDTGSEDKTIEIAKKYADKLECINWIDDFSYARNYAINMASKDYFIWFDADDVLLEEDKNKILKLKNEITDENIILLKYNLGDNFSFYRERIIKNVKINRFQGFVHEAIPLFGKLLYKDISITHKKIKSHSDRNLNMYKNKEKIRPFNSRELYYYGNELLEHSCFNKAKEIYEKFVSCKSGLEVNKIDASIKLYYLYKQFNELEKAKETLINSLKYGLLLHRQVFEIGNMFYCEKKYNTAISYFTLCLNLEVHPFEFSIKDYEKYLPYLYLGLCYYYLNDNKKAYEYNELALKEKPNDTYALNNKKYYI